jgi:hypothetical protein
MATASEETGTAIQAAVDAATAEREVCGGPLLEETIGLLGQAKDKFAEHEAQEDGA